MVIEIRSGGSRHRCTDCGTKWWTNESKAHWVPCVYPEGHTCPKCPDEPKPAEPECRLPHAKWGNWNYCPICGVALTKEA